MLIPAFKSSDIVQYHSYVTAVTDTVRASGRISFTLKAGLTAPVSRGFAKALKQDGWL